MPVEKQNIPVQASQSIVASLSSWHQGCSVKQQVASLGCPTVEPDRICLQAALSQEG